MYVCIDCGLKFENPLTLKEKHNLDTPPYESLYLCPRCKSTNLKLSEIKYCRCCGARLKGEQTHYCSSACKQKGERLWRKELRHKKQLYDCDLFKLVREVDEYNQKHKTRLSYGQYVALIKFAKSKRRKKK